MQSGFYFLETWRSKAALGLETSTIGDLRMVLGPSAVLLLAYSTERVVGQVQVKSLAYAQDQSQRSHDIG